MKRIAILLVASIVLASCVSKKKYVALETENGQLKSELTKTKVEKEDLETKFAVIQDRVDKYNTKINSLTSLNASLEEDNDSKMETVGNIAVMSNKTKKDMRATLSKVPPAYLMNAKTLQDSMNIAVSYNLKHAVDNMNEDEDEDIAINIEETVVMISISDKMLFNSGSYRVSNKANAILQKLANIVNSEPSIDVMVEGHTDARSINTDILKDNWDLSVLRATSVVRKLQNDYKVAPEKLIASGRSSFQPLVDNDSRDNRAKNRRTRIIILPNIDKFFALMASKDKS